MGSIIGMNEIFVSGGNDSIKGTKNKKEKKIT